MRWGWNDDLMTIFMFSWAFNPYISEKKCMIAIVEVKLNWVQNNSLYMKSIYNLWKKKKSDKTSKPLIWIFLKQKKRKKRKEIKHFGQYSIFLTLHWQQRDYHIQGPER